MGFLSFIGDAISDIFGGTTGRRDQQKYNIQNMAIQQEYARQNMADQNYYNVQAFNRENEYNSPVAQMQRNYAAGINPLWSDGGQVVAQQDSATSPNMPSGGMPSAGNTDFLGTLANLLSLKSNIQKSKSETNYNNAKADEIRAKIPGEVVNLDANTKALLASAFKTEQEANYYYTDLVKRWEHLGFENMSLQTAIKRIEELLPYDKEKMSAEAQQAIMAASLSFILAKCKPQEVAIEQQNANSNTTQAAAAAQNASSNAKQVQENIRHNLKVEENDMFHNISERIEANEHIRNNKAVNSLQGALNASIINLNNSYSKYYDSSTGKVKAEAYYQEMYNDVYKMLKDYNVQAETANAVLWKLQADKQKIVTETEKLGQEIQYFNDAYFGKLLKDYLPIPFLK